MRYIPYESGAGTSLREQPKRRTTSPLVVRRMASSAPRGELGLGRLGEGKPEAFEHLVKEHRHCWEVVKHLTALTWTSAGILLAGMVPAAAVLLTWDEPAGTWRLAVATFPAALAVSASRYWAVVAKRWQFEALLHQERISQIQEVLGMKASELVKWFDQVAQPQRRPWWLYMIGYRAPQECTDTEARPEMLEVYQKLRGHYRFVLLAGFEAFLAYIVAIAWGAIVLVALVRCLWLDS